MAAQDSAARYSLIQENLAEVLNDEIIKKILDEGKHPKIYWGRFIVYAGDACARVKVYDTDRRFSPPLQAPRQQAARTAATSSPPSRSPSSSPRDAT